MVKMLAAAVFGEQRKLEPMAPDRKARWKKEVGWLLSVADQIVEFVAKKQVLDNGVEMEVRLNKSQLHLLLLLLLPAPVISPPSSALLCWLQVMGTQQRRDLQSNIPALRKIDAMLLVRNIIFQANAQQSPPSARIAETLCGFLSRITWTPSRTATSFGT